MGRAPAAHPSRQVRRVRLRACRDGSPRGACPLRLTGLTDRRFLRNIAFPPCRGSWNSADRLVDALTGYAPRSRRSPRSARRRRTTGGPGSSGTPASREAPGWGQRQGGAGPWGDPSPTRRESASKVSVAGTIVSGGPALSPCSPVARGSRKPRGRCLGPGRADRWRRAGTPAPRLRFPARRPSAIALRARFVSTQARWDARPSVRGDGTTLGAGATGPDGGSTVAVAASRTWTCARPRSTSARSVGSCVRGGCGDAFIVPPRWERGGNETAEATRDDSGPVGPRSALKTPIARRPEIRRERPCHS